MPVILGYSALLCVFWNLYVAEICIYVNICLWILFSFTHMSYHMWPEFCNKVLFCSVLFCKTDRRSALACRCLPFESWEISFGLLARKPRFFVAMFIQNWINPIMQRAKCDRWARGATSVGQWKMAGKPQGNPFFWMLTWWWNRWVQTFLATDILLLDLKTKPIAKHT